MHEYEQFIIAAGLAIIAGSIFLHQLLLSAGSQRVREILTFGWWIYVFIMMTPQLFTWEGVDQLFIKFFVMMIMLAIPLIFD